MLLKQFYYSNINPQNYYYRFKVQIDNFDNDIDIEDSIDAIQKFKDCLQPQNCENDNAKYAIPFVLLCYYLNTQGFIIEQIPELFSELPIDDSLFNIGNQKIRTLIQKKRGMNGTVTWAERRNYIDSLKIVSNKYNITEEINTLMATISTNDISFQRKSQAEKLCDICNVIEYLLKTGDHFLSITNEKLKVFINDEIIKKYRETLHCFRHAHKKALNERNNYSDFELDTLIRYGIFVVSTIDCYLKQKGECL